MKTKYRILEYSNCFTIQYKYLLFWWSHGKQKHPSLPDYYPATFNTFKEAEERIEILKSEELNKKKYPILHNLK